MKAIGYTAILAGLLVGGCAEIGGIMDGGRSDRGVRTDGVYDARGNLIYSGGSALYDAAGNVVVPALAAPVQQSAYPRAEQGAPRFDANGNLIYDAEADAALRSAAQASGGVSQGVDQGAGGVVYVDKTTGRRMTEAEALAILAQQGAAPQAQIQQPQIQQPQRPALQTFQPQGGQYALPAPQSAPIQQTQSADVGAVLYDAPVAEEPAAPTRLAGLRDPRTPPAPALRPAGRVQQAPQKSAAAPAPAAPAKTTGEAPAGFKLAGTSWRLVSIGGRPVKAGADLHFDGANGTAGGQGPCNLYGGRFEEGAGKVAISGVFATERACPDLETEKAFLAAIEGVSGYGVNRQTDHLSLTGAGGKELLAFEAY